MGQGSAKFANTDLRMGNGGAFERRQFNICKNAQWKHKY
jgi:hypothetical protein